MPGQVYLKMFNVHSQPDNLLMCCWRMLLACALVYENMHVVLYVQSCLLLQGTPQCVASARRPPPAGSCNEFRAGLVNAVGSALSSSAAALRICRKASSSRSSHLKAVASLPPGRKVTGLIYNQINVSLQISRNDTAVAVSWPSCFIKNCPLQKKGLLCTTITITSDGSSDSSLKIKTLFNGDRGFFVQATHCGDWNMH